MSFFNNKEEVISIELTQYGKLLLSKGIFEPVYYSFFDDEIIYDSLYANFSESQNDIETRILEESIYKKPIYNLKGSETNLENIFLQDLEGYSEENTISTVDSVNKYAPAWELNILDGTTISSSFATKEVYTASGSLKTVNIPQINLEPVSILVNIQNKNKPNISFDVTTKNILLQLEELNVIAAKENFEIEIFEIKENDDVGNEKLSRLYFIEKPIYIKNDIMLENPIISKTSAELDDTLVEYYFEINPDIELNDDITKKIIAQDAKYGKNIKE